MKILLFGKDGQLGSELQHHLQHLGTLIALGKGGAHELCGDLGDLDGISATVEQVRPDWIVNAAAYTNVELAEQEMELAFLLNASAPEVLARQALNIGACFIHYSTDYVFNGSGHQPWKETDATQPLNVYGLSKLVGEQRIQESGCRYFIFRTSWIHAAQGNNFIKTILRLARERSLLQVVHDQTGAPTSAHFLAACTAQVIMQVIKHPAVLAQKQGLYHLTASGETSWHGYAGYVLETAEQLGMFSSEHMARLQAIPSADYPTKAQRPLNSRLDCSLAQQKLSLVFPPWQQGVAEVLQQLAHAVSQSP